MVGVACNGFANISLPLWKATGRFTTAKLGGPLNSD
jgi:hypothetical protein